jgi:TrmH family RNA methyltransferase
VEGEKSVQEVLISDFDVLQVFVSPDFSEKHNGILKTVKAEVVEVKPSELAGLGDYTTNDAALAIVRMKPNVKPAVGKNEFAIMLDDLRDPGNLGTIIRTADWYGIHTIIASEETADVYNSKVIQSSMGSFTRVGLFYTNLEGYLRESKSFVFGAFLDGENVHSVEFGEGGIIVIGNESNGISKAVEKFVTRRITIPKYGYAESLNAAIATAVICDNVRRR